MLAQKILEAIQQPIQLDSTTAVISASIGIAIHHADDIINAAQLITGHPAKLTGIPCDVRSQTKAGRLVFAVHK